MEEEEEASKPHKPPDSHAAAVNKKPPNRDINTVDHRRGFGGARSHYDAERPGEFIHTQARGVLPRTSGAEH